MNQSKPPSNRAGVALWGVGLVFWLLIGAVSIHVPFGRDQGVAAYVATVMQQGGAVYRDVYHFNLPGIFVVYRAALMLPLPPTEAVNLTHLVFVALAGLGVYLAGRRIMSGRSAALAANFYFSFAVVMYTAYWDIAQKESLAAAPLAFALWALLSLVRADSKEGVGAREILVWSALFGVFAGLASQFKPTLAMTTLAILLPAWRLGKSWTRPVAAGAAGFVISFAPLLIWLSASGSLAPMIESVFKFGGFYGSSGWSGFWPVIHQSVTRLASWIFRWRFLAALVCAALLYKDLRARPGFKTVALFGLLLLFQLVVQMKYFSYHFIPLLAPAALLAAAGASKLFGSMGDKPLRRALEVVLALLFVGNLAPEAARYQRELAYDFGLVTETDFLSPYGKWGSGDLNPLASRAVADYVRDRTDKSDSILVFGLEPGLYTRAQRMAPTRFAYDQPLVTDPRGNREFARYREEMRAEFMADLNRRPPLYILVIENDKSPVEALDSNTQMTEFKEFHEFVKSGYFLETKVEDYFVYRRKPVTGRSG